MEKLTEKEKELIRVSWESLGKNKVPHGVIMFSRLFELEPALLNLFHYNTNCGTIQDCLSSPEFLDHVTKVTLLSPSLLKLTVKWLIHGNKSTEMSNFLLHVGVCSRFFVLYVFVCVCVHSCVCLCVCVHSCACLCVCSYILVRVCVCVCVLVCPGNVGDRCSSQSPGQPPYLGGFSAQPGEEAPGSRG
uniref:Globin domain-containing protein n=1 Tax=Oncorhynchus mykiss TaxID=8022 RepID=A0A8C7PCP6_ONCMY